MRWEKSRIACVLVVSLALSARAHAQSAADEAARHFERAIAHADAHEFDAALIEFEKAYELSPHYSVQYNIGLASAAAGRTLAAVRAFERYLAEGGAEIPAERRAQITALIRAERAKLAILELELEPRNAEVVLDGNPTTLPEKGLELEPGAHELVVRAPGHLERRLPLTLRAGETSNVVVALTHVSSEKVALHCGVPDVEVLLDGQPLANTGEATGALSLTVPEGKSSLALRRAGYETQPIVLVRHADRPVRCDLRSLPASRTARLTLRVSEPGFSASLDGEPYRNESLVPGRHRVVVTRAGFSAFARTVSLAPGQRLGLDVELVPTAAHRAEYEQRARLHRTGAYVAGIAGLGAGVAALATRLSANHLFSVWNEEQAKLPPLGAPTPPTPAEVSAQAENDERRERVQTLDRASLGLAITSGVLLGGAAALYFTGSDPDRYRQKGRVGVAVAGTSLKFQAEF